MANRFGFPAIPLLAKWRQCFTSFHWLGPALDSFSFPARACCLAGSLINHVHYPFVIVNLLNRQHYSCSNGWRSPTKKLGAWRHSFQSLFPRDFSHGEAILFDVVEVDFWAIFLAVSLVSYYLFSFLCELFLYIFVMIFFFHKSKPAHYFVCQTWSVRHSNNTKAQMGAADIC